ncbi:hypothetical protein [Methylomonas rosea]|uniref:ANR family transcriptional regulator n=1 Tax=Methylomonas rosea TaxID=2952227 RepID=A0ABT1TN18_9GAMM|nr:hypothetical protein [Methylomonas sp. WSC-7]MCQ8116122.1 hypothetical protein [Methylomonas sp. WSC-7]
MSEQEIDFGKGIQLSTQDKRSQKEFCQDLMRKAPENSDEYWAFHRAAHYYEEAEFHKNKNRAAHLARMKAVRAYKKAWKLRYSRYQPCIAIAVNKSIQEACHV